nr:MAG TPA: helix-turn-helix domain protein [Caudoviricetes sp.]
MKSIGERIREKRQNLGYTLEKLANEIGVTPSTILKYENGGINIPSDKIEKLSIALKTTPAYLMGWEDEIHIFAPDITPTKYDKKDLVSLIDGYRLERNMTKKDLMEKFHLKNWIDEKTSLVELQKIAKDCGIDIKEKTFISLKPRSSHLKELQDWFIKNINTLNDDQIYILKKEIQKLFDNILKNKEE